MTGTYKIEGMTCTGCRQIVHDLLSKVAGVKQVTVDLKKGQAKIDSSDAVPTASLVAALSGSLYSLSEIEDHSNGRDRSEEEALAKHRSLVASYVAAVGHLQYEQLQEFLHPDFTFNGAVTLHSAADFIAMIKEHAEAPTAGIIVGNDIKAIFADGNDACVIYEAVADCPVDPVPFVEWIEIAEGKILSTRVKFDRLRMRQLMAEVRKEAAS